MYMYCRILNKLTVCKVYHKLIFDYFCLPLHTSSVAGHVPFICLDVLCMFIKLIISYAHTLLCLCVHPSLAPKLLKSLLHFVTVDMKDVELR